MSDLISRQAAIDAVKQREWLTEDAKEILEEVLTQLPSAQRTGEWIQIESKGHKTNIKYLYKCSVCGMVDWFDSNYCPECGSYNGGKNEV